MSVLSLAELQHAFRAHLLGGEAPALEAAIRGDRIPAAARLRIYRHHVFSSLTAALGATFSTVRGVVGGDFFADMARAFVAQWPPSGPVLSEYGGDFPDFVGRWQAAAALPYLGDAARLDWALNLACNAADTPALGVDDLASLPAERLPELKTGLRAGVTLLTSRWPIDRIWALNHEGGDETVDLGAGGVSLLVFPRADDAAFAALDPGVAALVAGLRDGLPLGSAFERAQARQPDLDAGAALTHLLALHALAAPDVRARAG
jgi:hypothetical protein